MKRTRSSQYKSAKALIEQRVREHHEYDPGEQAELVYVCLDTGLAFETFNNPAMYSPFTGSQNISLEAHPEDYEGPAVASDDEYGDEYGMYGEQVTATMQPTPVPPSQKDPKKQVPVSPNPIATEPPPRDNDPWTANPSPDAQGDIGAVRADARGFLPYPQVKTPSSTTTAKNATAGDRTDRAPAGSK